jgi:hypothetical protein
VNPFGALTRYTRRTVVPGKIAAERCELCGVDLIPEHRHVVDLQRRALCCACQACALLFHRSGAAGGRYKTVPQRVLVDPRLRFTEAEWGALQIPVQLAFFFFNSSANRWTGVYPSAAGPVESTLPLDAWNGLLERHALIRALEPDVEALIAYAPRGQQELEAFLVPIDRCYELVARVRTKWKGFDGREAREEISRFFEVLRSRGRPLKEGR